MDNYSKKSVNKSKNQNNRKVINKKKLIIVIAAILAVVIVVGGIIGWFCSKKDSKPSSGEPEVSVSQLENEKTTVDSSNEATGSDVAPTTEQNTNKEPAKFDKIMYVTASTLNVREKPSVDSKVIAKFAEGNEARVVGKYNSDWYIVDINGQKGYCSSAYLSDKKGTQIKEAAPYMLFVNRKQNIVTAYKKDANGDYTVPVRAMICSVGNEQGETPVGTFHTTARYTWRLLVGGVYGQYATRITGPILFHSVPYLSQNKGNLDYKEYNKLGVPASHGCVRLAVADAKWIYDNCPPGTPVKIYDSDKKEPLPRPAAQKIDPKSPNRGWDPTDPDAKNPWKR